MKITITVDRDALEKVVVAAEQEAQYLRSAGEDSSELCEAMDAVWEAMPKVKS